MASKFLKKINAKLKFLYCQSKYLSPAYWRLLCNVLIQPLWDYGFSSWFPLLKKKLKLKLQKAQNRCTCFYLTLPLRSHINPSHFRKINWCLYCEYWNSIVPGYIHEIFKPSLRRYSTRSQMALEIICRK